MVFDFDNVLNSFLGPLLNLPSLWALIVVSIAVTLLATLAYKWATDQHLMKTLKDDLKKFQTEMKEFREDPKKVLEIQKRAMETNMKYMMHSMKPMVITIIPFLLIFSWLNANLAFEPIMPEEKFSTIAIFDKGVGGEITLIDSDGIELLSKATQPITDDQAAWFLKGPAGEYTLEYQFNNESHSQDLIITKEQAYKGPEFPVKNSKLKKLQINNNKKTFLNLFGWEIGWLGSYILFSMVFNLAFRKLFKLH